MYTGTCKNCNKEFTYKWHGRGNVCSLECSAIYISKCVRKYTDEQIANVIALKKAGKLNSQIVQESGVNINKVKEIVKENGLFVPKDEVQSRAYKAKLAKNP